MKLFKLDLMTVLAIVVAIGVVATMSTQASDRSTAGLEVVQDSAQTVVQITNKALPARH